MTFNFFGVRITFRKEFVFVAAVCIAIVLGLTGYYIVKSDRKIIIDAKAPIQNKESGKDEGQADNALSDQSDVMEDSQTGNKASDADSNSKNAHEDEIKVYVVGCVKNPGIVTLVKGQLIDDAVRAAGGATEEADLQNINMVYKLKDNVMLTVYSKKESSARKESGEAGTGIKITRDSGGAVVNDDDSGDGVNAKININTASLGELDTLPGIGEATAGDIIDYRQKNGPFKTIRDIMKVPRIKESRFNKIKDYIKVE